MRRRLFDRFPLLQLTGGHCFLGDDFKKADILIDGGKIWKTGSFQAPIQKRFLRIDLTDHMVLPGFINSHDHLEFGLFPTLARQKYSNYVDWVDDIHQFFADEIERAKKIPLKDRLWASAYRNLLSGVTSVIHHNPYHREIGKDFPIRVYPRLRWKHSIHYSHEGNDQFWKILEPLVIHLAEGADERSRAEVISFFGAQSLFSRSVVVHGVAINEENLRFVKPGTGLVWCPRSNMNLYEKTADIGLLKKNLAIMLGTDSEMTGPADFFGELKEAQKIGFLSNLELLRASTLTPSEIFHWKEIGAISNGRQADIVVLRLDGSDPWSMLGRMGPASIDLVLRAGYPVVFSEAVARQLNFCSSDFSRVSVAGHRLFVKGPLAYFLKKWRDQNWLGNGFLSRFELVD